MADVKIKFNEIDDEERSVPFSLDSGTILIEVSKNDHVHIEITSAEDALTVMDALRFIVDAVS